MNNYFFSTLTNYLNIIFGIAISLIFIFSNLQYYSLYNYSVISLSAFMLFFSLIDNRIIQREFNKEKNKTFNSVFIFKLFISILFLILFFIYFFFINFNFDSFLIALNLIIIHNIGFFLVFLESNYKFKNILFTSFLSNILMLIFSIIFLIIFFSYTLYLFSLLLVSLFKLLVILIYLFKTNNFFVKIIYFSNIRNLIKSSFILFLSSFLFFFSSKVDSLIIGSSNLAQFSYYFLALQLYNYLISTNESFRKVSAVKLLEQTNQSDYFNLYKKMTTISTFFSIIIVFIYFLISIFVRSFLLFEPFLSIFYFFDIFIVASIFSFNSYLRSTHLVIVGKPNVIFIIQFCSAIFSLIYFLVFSNNIYIMRFYLLFFNIFSLILLNLFFDETRAIFFIQLNAFNPTKFINSVKFLRKRLK